MNAEHKSSMFWLKITIHEKKEDITMLWSINGIASQIIVTQSSSEVSADGGRVELQQGQTQQG